jgi:DHA2 family multidrug resistance protein-like MFS transporter
LDIVQQSGRIAILDVCPILIEVQAMSRQWMTLMAILLVYIPVAIDATVLHVAAPTSACAG